MESNELMLRALGGRKDSIFVEAGQAVREAFPGKAVFETEEDRFRPEVPGDGWTFDVSDQGGALVQTDWHWLGHRSRTYCSPRVGWFQAQWGGLSIPLLRMQVMGQSCPVSRWYIVADTVDVARSFFEHVCRWHSTVRGEVLVFQEGYWRADQELYEHVQSSDFEELVLHGSLKEQIVSDIETFLGQEETYDRYRIPWKRGMLFLGPPGNGKTHMLRALMKRFPNQPCLYVKSFSARYGSSQSCVASAFDRARETAPCFFILEDLDTLLTGQTRSFFLNEMDGFASNRGIVTLATCNFPERLDPAILERPSRFDRKYHFELPDRDDRTRYLGRFMTRFEESLRLDAEGLERISEATEGYSYAYLKELYVSSAVRWIATDAHRRLQDVLAEQAATLRDQMVTEWAEPPPAPEDLRAPYGFYSDD